MEYFKDDLSWARAAKAPLHIIVVGAGIGGLSVSIGLAQCGHKVTLLEQVSQLADIGAGIQLAPNSTRILGRFGVLQEAVRYMTFLRENRVKRWKNGEQLATTPFMPEMAERYFAPGGVIHRADLQKVLLQEALRAGVHLRTDAGVSKVHEDFEPLVQLKSGEWLSGDLVIAADGIKSGVRRQIAAAHDQIDQPLPTGDSAYRLVIPADLMKNDKVALGVFEQEAATRWIGPGGHVITYPLRNRETPVMNMALLRTKNDQGETDLSWNRKGDKREMIEFYKEWDDIVQRFMGYAPEGEVVEWILNTHEPLKSWHKNKVVLMGDACHPMLPYVAQGAAQAIEDAGVIAVLLSLISSKEEIPSAISAYETVRKDRAERIQASAEANKASLHLIDGPEQEERDRRMRAAQKGQGNSPDQFGDMRWQGFMWGEDVMKQALQTWSMPTGKHEIQL